MELGVLPFTKTDEGETLILLWRANIASRIHSAVYYSDIACERRKGDVTNIDAVARGFSQAVGGCFQVVADKASNSKEKKDKKDKVEKPDKKGKKDKSDKEDKSDKKKKKHEGEEKSNEGSVAEALSSLTESDVEKLIKDYTKKLKKRLQLRDDIYLLSGRGSSSSSGGSKLVYSLSVPYISSTILNPFMAKYGIGNVTWVKASGLLEFVQQGKFMSSDTLPCISHDGSSSSHDTSNSNGVQLLPQFGGLLSKSVSVLGAIAGIDVPEASVEAGEGNNEGVFEKNENKGEGDNTPAGVRQRKKDELSKTVHDKLGLTWLYELDRRAQEEKSMYGEGDCVEGDVVVYRCPKCRIALFTEQEIESHTPLDVEMYMAKQLRQAEERREAQIRREEKRRRQEEAEAKAQERLARGEGDEGEEEVDGDMYEMYGDEDEDEDEDMEWVYADEDEDNIHLHNQSEGDEEEEEATSTIQRRQGGRESTRQTSDSKDFNGEDDNDTLSETAISTRPERSSRATKPESLSSLYVKPLFSRKQAHKGFVPSYIRPGATGEEVMEGSAQTCTSYFLTAEPHPLLSSQSANEGPLCCPGCSFRVGYYTWGGSQCSCGKWITPALQVQRKKVDSAIMNATQQRATVNQVIDEVIKKAEAKASQQKVEATTTKSTSAQSNHPESHASSSTASPSSSPFTASSSSSSSATAATALRNNAARLGITIVGAGLRRAPPTARPPPRVLPSNPPTNVSTTIPSPSGTSSSSQNKSPE